MNHKIHENTLLRNKLFGELIIKYNPKFKSDEMKYMIINHPEIFKFTHLIEETIALLSNGAFTFVDANHYDFSDGSECKTATLYDYLDVRSLAFAEITNIRANSGKLKSGAVRCIILNPIDKKLHFIVIPVKSIYKLMTHKNGKPKKSNSIKLSYNKKYGFYKTFKKYNIIECKDIAELASIKNI